MCEIDEVAVVGTAEMIVVEVSKGAFGRRDVGPVGNVFIGVGVVIGEVDGLLLERGFDFSDHVFVELRPEVVGVEYGVEGKGLMRLHNYYF